jgi:hypothetical protein
MKKLHALIMATVALLATPVASFAQFTDEGVWTSVCSVGVIDEANVGLYQFNGSNLFFANGRTGSIIARYNVVNTSNAFGTQQPAWNTFELGYTDIGAGTITAFLYEVNPCTGAQTTICSFTAPNSAVGGSCATCTFPSTTFDFESNLYFIALVVSRTSTQQNPIASTLRLYANP